MMQLRWLVLRTWLMLAFPLAAHSASTTSASRPDGTLTVAVATVGEERARIMREEMGPWLYEHMPAVSIGATQSIAGIGPKVGEWPLIPGHMGLHNWEYVTHSR